MFPSATEDLSLATPLNNVQAICSSWAVWRHSHQARRSPRQVPLSTQHVAMHQLSHKHTWEQQTVGRASAAFPTTPVLQLSALNDPSDTATQPHYPDVSAGHRAGFGTAHGSAFSRASQQQSGCQLLRDAFG